MVLVRRETTSLFNLFSSKVAYAGKNDSVVDFKADIFGVVDGGSKIYEILYNFKVMTVSSGVEDKT